MTEFQQLTGPKPPHRSRPFMVEYEDTRCADCGSAVELGEWAVFEDDELVHEDCGFVDAPVSVCDVCWQMKARSGACGCP